MTPFPSLPARPAASRSSGVVLLRFGAIVIVSRHLRAALSYSMRGNLVEPRCPPVHLNFLVFRPKYFGVAKLVGSGQPYRRDGGPAVL